MKSNDEKLIDSILADLFELDPELKRMEDQVRQTVERLLEHRLTPKIDKRFVEHLRKDLLMSGATGVRDEVKSVSIKLYMKRVTLMLGGSAVLAACLLVAVSVLRPGGFSLPGLGVKLTSENMITLGPEAFGSLAAADSGLQTAPQESADAIQVVGRGGGGAPGMVPGAVGMPAPEYARASFTYDGGPIEAPGDQVTVYRRIKGIPTAALASAFAGRDNGLFDLSRLSSLQVRTANLTHVDGGKEYSINLDFRESLVSISHEDIMLEAMPAATEVPDADLIAIAGAFLDRYGVDRSGYGDPTVDERWRDAMMPEDASYFPTYVGVVYPLMVGGETAVGWDGEPNGLRVNINASTRTAQGAFTITRPRFESSAYPAETDMERVISYAERGGYLGPVYLPKEGQSDLRLGTPSLMYVQNYVFDGTTGKSDELYVPALFFPIENAQAGIGIYRKYVVVPLAKELLDQREDMLGDLPVPMPVVEPAVMTEPSMAEDGDRGE